MERLNTEDCFSNNSDLRKQRAGEFVLPALAFSPLTKTLHLGATVHIYLLKLKISETMSAFCWNFPPSWVLKYPQNEYTIPLTEAGLYTLGKFSPAEIWIAPSIAAGLSREGCFVRNKFNSGTVVGPGFWPELSLARGLFDLSRDSFLYKLHAFVSAAPEGIRMWLK